MANIIVWLTFYESDGLPAPFQENIAPYHMHLIGFLEDILLPQIGLRFRLCLDLHLPLVQAFQGQLHILDR